MFLGGHVFATHGVDADCHGAVISSGCVEIGRRP
jgi:hypothetical protein